MKHFNFYQLAMLGLITAGIAIRLININQPLLEFFPQRQTQTAEITRNIYKNGWPDFWTPKVRYLAAGEPIPYVLEFPLYNGIVAGLYHLFGPNVLWGRIVSLTFFVGSSFIFYRLVKLSIIHYPSSIYALLFFIFSPLHILISRSFQPEELALFLFLLAVYKKSWLIFSLAILIKLPIALFAPLILFASRYSETAKDCRRITSRFFAPLRMTVSLIPTVIWYFRAGQLTVHPAIARNFEITNWFQPALWLNPKWYFSLFQIEQIWVLTTLGLLFFWLGLWSIVQTRPGLATQGQAFIKSNIWLVWLLNGLLYLSIFNYHAMTHEYYHLFLLPPLSIFVGIGLNQIVNITKGYSKNIRAVAIAGILSLLILGLIQPAVKKINSAPKSPGESTEVTPARYFLIESF